MKDYHYHDYYELYCVRSGKCRVFAEDDIKQLTEGCYIILPPECLHYTRYHESCHRFAAYFRREDLDDTLADLIQFDGKFQIPRVIYVSSVWQSSFLKLMDGMISEEHLRDDRSKEIIRLKLGELLLLLDRYGEQEEVILDDIHSDDAGIIRSARYMTRHFGDHLPQSVLADISGYSANYFSRRFKETTGIGAHQYLTLIRLKNAANLLISTEQSVMDIALSVGFSDANYLRTLLRSSMDYLQGRIETGKKKRYKVKMHFFQQASDHTKMTVMEI